MTPTETTKVWKPHRYLDPQLAGAIANAKVRSGLSWRQLALLTGVSHPHLVLIAGGKRVPSDLTVERIARWLDIDEELLDQLRRVATPKRYYSA